MKKLAILLAVMLLAAPALAQSSPALPAGTALKLKLENTLSTFKSKKGDSFSARVTEAVIVDGKTMIPVGAVVKGRVTKVAEPRRIAGRPTIGILPETIVLPTGESYPLSASLVDTGLRHGTDVNDEGQFKGAGHDRNDLVEVGAGTGGGMLAGGLIGGGAGVLIGGTVGATAATAHWLSRRNSAMLPAGTELFIELNRPMEMAAASGAE